MVGKPRDDLFQKKPRLIGNINFKDDLNTDVSVSKLFYYFALFSQLLLCEISLFRFTPSDNFVHFLENQLLGSHPLISIMVEITKPRPFTAKIHQME